MAEVNSCLTNDRTRRLDVLALSYNHLPTYLKSSFLYLGLYPEVLEISGRGLMKLWVAEGFIQRIRDRVSG